MAIRVYKPTTAGRRNASVSDFSELTRSTGAGNNEHNTSVFVAVGPSEAVERVSQYPS